MLKDKLDMLSRHDSDGICPGNPISKSRFPLFH